MTRTKYTSIEKIAEQRRAAKSKHASMESSKHSKSGVGKLVLTKTKGAAAAGAKSKEDKKRKFDEAKAKAAAAAMALSDDDDDEDDEDFTEDPNAVASSSDDDELDDEFDEEDDEMAGPSRPPIGKQLALPSGDAAAVAQLKQGGSKETAAHKHMRENRRSDSFAAREQSGLFGKKRACKIRPSAFQGMLKEFAATMGGQRPHIAKAAIVCMQQSMEVMTRVAILPAASEALVVSQTCGEPAALETARMEKKILYRHMEFAVRAFVRRISPSLESVLDANLDFVLATEAKKAAKRARADAKAKHTAGLKSRIEHLRKKETRFLTEAAAADNVDLTEAERQELIDATLEYENICLIAAKKKVAVLTDSIANAQRRLAEELPLEVSKAKKAIVTLEQQLIPATVESIESTKAQILREDKALDEWLEANRQELLASASKTIKRTDEQKKLRKDTLAMRRSLTSTRTALVNLEKKLASQKRMIKKRGSSIEAKRIEMPRLKEKITKNKLSLAAAQVTVSTWLKAIRKGKQVRKDEDAMEEDEEEADV